MTLTAPRTDRADARPSRAARIASLVVPGGLLVVGTTVALSLLEAHAAIVHAVGALLVLH
jgi:hypothetical protein